MNSSEPYGRSDLVLPLQGSIADRNYYAFFDKPVPENLAANRRGVLAPQQRGAIEGRIADHRNITALIIGMILCVDLFVLFFFWVVDSEDGVLSFTNLIISIGVVTLLLTLLAVTLTGDFFFLFARNDLEDDRVESVTGQIEWKGNGYRISSEARQLRSLRRGVALPPPGKYLFYHLPRTGLVVMAEEAEESSTEKSVPAIQQALARANHFLPEDLAQNQKGLLSEKQENSLMLIFALDVFIVLSSAVLGGSILFQLFQGHSSSLFLPLILSAALLFLRFGWSIAQIIGDLWNGKASRVEGTVARETRWSRYSRSYYYVAGSHRFQVSEAAYNALFEGKTYCIYFVPRSQRLVSIELL